MILCTVLVATLWMRPAVTSELPTISSSEDISRINSLGSEEAPPVSIDPKLRRALLRVLTKLEEQDQKKGNQESAQQIAEVMQNIISEEDFIKYFQEQGLERELLSNVGSKESEKADEHKNEEILSYSSEDAKKEVEQPFTFASYPEDDKEVETTQDTVLDVKNKEKYPSTFPTPSLGDAIYFQIPEPIQISDSPKEEEEEERGEVNVQETRSIQGPTLVSPTEQSNHEEERQVPQEVQKVTFIRGDQSQKYDVENESGEEEEVKTQVDFQASNGTEVEDTEDSGNVSMKVKMEKHEVEFLHAPLLAAFTVQQDQQGLPRRVIPLNYQLSGDLPIPLPSNKDQPDVTKTNSLEEKQRLLQQQVKFLQEQQLQEEQYQRLQQFVKERQRLLDEEAQRQQLHDTQKRQYENEQRLVFARQKQQQILFQNQQQNNQLDYDRQRYYQQQNIQQHQSFQPIQQQNQPQTFNFQKSVDFQFQANSQQPQPQPLNSFQPSFNNFNNFQPSVELNRVNRHEPSNFVGNFGLSTPQPSFNFHSSGFSTVQPFVQPTQPTYAQPSNFIQSNYRQHRFSQHNNFVAPPPVSLDGQLQSLLSLSGIAGGLSGKPHAHEDLNIVSKVLALGHGEPPATQYARQQFQASTRHESVVEPPRVSNLVQPPTPSRVIEPPKL